MPKSGRYTGLTLENTPRNLLCYLENDMVRGDRRRLAVGKLLREYPNLDKGQQERFEVYMLKKGSVHQRKRLGDLVEQERGKSLLDKNP